MKKEDLCMLLVVVALVLIISRNTKLFEGMENAGGSSITETIEDMLGLDGEPSPVESGMNSNSNANVPPPRPVQPPTPPTPPRPVQPPQPSMPPTPPQPRAMPPTPPTPSQPRAMPPTPPQQPPTPPQPRAMPPTAPQQPPQPRAMPPTAPQQPPQPRAMPPTAPQQPPQPRAMPPTAPQPRAMPTPVGQQGGEPSPFGTPLMDNRNGAFGQGFVGAFDNEVASFASATHEEQYGEKIPVSMQQEYLTMKSLGTLTPQIMQNLEQQRSQGVVMGSEFKPFDPSSTSGSLLDQQFAGLQTGPQQPSTQQARPTPPQPRAAPQQPPTPSRPASPPTPPTGGGGAPVEVHMVYGSWCGHSKRAMPAFEELVSESSVTTGSGSPVNFVMTEDTSEGMKQFEGKVRGFPTYMVVKSDGSMDELTGHNRTKESIIQAVQSL